MGPIAPTPGHSGSRLASPKEPFVKGDLMTELRTGGALLRATQLPKRPAHVGRLPRPARLINLCIQLRTSF